MDSDKTRSLLTFHSLRNNSQITLRHIWCIHEMPVDKRLTASPEISSFHCAPSATADFCLLSRFVFETHRLFTHNVNCKVVQAIRAYIIFAKVYQFDLLFLLPVTLGSLLASCSLFDKQQKPLHSQNKWKENWKLFLSLGFCVSIINVHEF